MVSRRLQQQEMFKDISPWVKSHISAYKKRWSDTHKFCSSSQASTDISNMWLSGFRFGSHQLRLLSLITQAWCAVVPRLPSHGSQVRVFAVCKRCLPCRFILLTFAVLVDIRVTRGVLFLLMNLSMQHHGICMSCTNGNDLCICLDTKI